MRDLKTATNSRNEDSAMNKPVPASPAQISDEQRALEVDCPVCAQKSGDWCLYQDFDTDSPAVSPTPHAERIARSRLEPVEAPKEQKTQIYEVYCSHARGMGWDFLVCKTMAEAIHAIESSIDMLEENEEEEIQVIFKKYTAEQMSEVVYE